MKCAIVIMDDIKQIMFTPENDSEKQALKMITPDDDIMLEIHEGSFYDARPQRSAMGYNVEMCRGGYLRAYENTNSIMLVLRKKESTSDPLHTHQD